MHWTHTTWIQFDNRSTYSAWLLCCCQYRSQLILCNILSSHKFRSNHLFIRSWTLCISKLRDISKTCIQIKGHPSDVKIWGLLDHRLVAQLNCHLYFNIPRTEKYSIAIATWSFSNPVHKLELRDTCIQIKAHPSHVKAGLKVQQIKTKQSFQSSSLERFEYSLISCDFYSLLFEFFFEIDSVFKNIFVSGLKSFAVY